MVFRNWLQQFRQQLVSKSTRRRKASKARLQTTDALEHRAAPGDITGIGMVFMVDMGHLPNLDIVMGFMETQDTVGPEDLLQPNQNSTSTAPVELNSGEGWAFDNQGVSDQLGDADTDTGNFGASSHIKTSLETLESATDSVFETDEWNGNFNSGISTSISLPESGDPFQVEEEPVDQSPYVPDANPGTPISTGGPDGILQSPTGSASSGGTTNSSPVGPPAGESSDGSFSDTEYSSESFVASSGYSSSGYSTAATEVTVGYAPTVRENEGGFFVINATTPSDEWEPGATGSITVDYQAVDGTAENGVDYILNDGTVEISLDQNGNGYAYVGFELIDDAINEEIETFALSIGSSSRTATILDDDALVQINLNSSSEEIWEHQGGIAAVTLSEANSNDIEVEYTFVEGTATAGPLANGDHDYVVSSPTGTVTVPAGGTFAYIPFSFNDDGRPESNETFSIQLTSSSAGSLGHTTFQTITILDDESVVDIWTSSEDVYEATGHDNFVINAGYRYEGCLLYTSPSPRD